MVPLEAQRIELPDDYDAVQELYLERGWSDGLPITPPTPRRVGAMLSAVSLDPQHVVAQLPPNWGDATVERLAINAVMAGCLPEYLPVIVAGVAAMSDPAFNLYAIQATTHSCAPLFIVNGPIRERLGMNSSSGAYGPGWRANATIGRAVRLALLNIGGGHPGVGDMSTQGAPSKYTYCIAENEEANPWEPLHVERGYSPNQSTVTVVGGEPPHNINDHTGATAEEILTIIAGAMAVTGANNAYTGGETLLALGPEHAATMSADGFYQGRHSRLAPPTRPHPPGTLHRGHHAGTLRPNPQRPRTHGSHPRRPGHDRTGRPRQTLLLGTNLRRRNAGR